ncbi:MAG TPA: hypothetical protein PK441_01220 [Burkholderiaceae bacterium]|nr:hypothetical protein [Burkholderiaceae bacterium]
MPLAAIGVALQGLDAPLSAIMAAVQGLLVSSVQPFLFENLGGLVAKPRPRHRMRRWSSMAAVPTPWQLLMEAERADEEDLFSIGVL